jgi:hypothetical protein
VSNRVEPCCIGAKWRCPVFSYVSGGLDDAEANGEISRLSLENADLRERVKQLGVRMEAMEGLVPDRKTGRKRANVWDAVLESARKSKKERADGCPSRS